MTSFDSSQGSTIYERYCVHGMEGRDGSPKVVWTVITRGVAELVFRRSFRARTFNEGL